MIKDISNMLEKLTIVFIVLDLIAMTTVTFIQVLCRYVFFHSLPWSEEFSRYCLVWLTYIGGSLGLKKGIHVAIEVCINHLPCKTRKIFKKVNYIFMLILLIILLTYGIDLSLKNMSQLSPSMHIPIGIVYLAVPVGSLFSIFHILYLICLN